MCVGYNFSSFEATLECERAPASESYGYLMIGNDHETGPISLIETLKGATESQGVINLSHVFPVQIIVMFRQRGQHGTSKFLLKASNPIWTNGCKVCYMKGW